MDAPAPALNPLQYLSVKTGSVILSDQDMLFFLFNTLCNQQGILFELFKLDPDVTVFSVVSSVLLVVV